MLKWRSNKPFVMAHAAGRGHGRENSLEALQATLPHNPDVVELDVRKSRDGVLFCYHGFPALPFWLLAGFLRWFGYKTIKRFLKTYTLEELVVSIPKLWTLFLDFKDRNISAGDIAKINFGSHKVWLAAYSLKVLSQWKKELGNRFVYIYNFSFLNFEKGVERSLKARVDVIKIFPWQASAEVIERLKKAKMAYTIQPVFISLKKYKKLVEKYGSLWICLDDLRKKEKWLIGI